MKIFGLEINRVQSREAVQDTTNQLGNNEGHSMDWLANVIDATRDGQAMGIPAVYRAIALRANAMARCIAQYQRRDAIGGNFTIDMGPTRGKHINYLMQVKPNDYINWSFLMKQAEVRRLLYGNAYIYVERRMDEEINAFYLCSSAAYDAHTNTYHITYFVGDLLLSKSNVPAAQVLHARMDNPLGFYGEGIISYAKRTFSLAATQQQLALDTAAKGGIRKLVVQEEKGQTYGVGKTNKAQMQTIAKDFARDLGLKDVTYLPNVAGFKDISQTLGELELLASRKFTITEVSQFFGVPRNLLGDDSNASYKTPEAATLDFLSNGIAPTIEEWEDEMNSKLLTEAEWGGHRYHLCENALFRLDRQGQALWNKNRMETGVVSINELRAESELPRIANGDDHYVSTNLAVAGSAKLTGAQPEPAQPKEEK